MRILLLFGEWVFGDIGCIFDYDYGDLVIEI